LCSLLLLLIVAEHAKAKSKIRENYYFCGFV
jgi:hypothetical protein